MATFLSNIGNAKEIGRLIGQAADEHQQTVSLLLDKLRTLEIRHKTYSKAQTVVRFRDISEHTTVIIYLPHEKGAAAQARIIQHGEH